MKVLFLSKRHSKPALVLKSYEKSSRNPKKIEENILGLFKVTLKVH